MQMLVCCLQVAVQNGATRQLKANLSFFADQTTDAQSRCLAHLSVASACLSWQVVLLQLLHESCEGASIQSGCMKQNDI